jgi:hypothetical protein
VSTTHPPSSHPAFTAAIRPDHSQQYHQPADTDDTGATAAGGAGGGGGGGGGDGGGGDGGDGDGGDGDDGDSQDDPSLTDPDSRAEFKRAAHDSWDDDQLDDLYELHHSQDDGSVGKGLIKSVASSVVSAEAATIIGGAIGMSTGSLPVVAATGAAGWAFAKGVGKGVDVAAKHAPESVRTRYASGAQTIRDSTDTVISKSRDMADYATSMLDRDDDTGSGVADENDNNRLFE